MINPLNELSDIYLGNISEEDNSPEAVKGRVMQYVRAIRYRSRKEGETLNKAYNEFMDSPVSDILSESQIEDFFIETEIEGEEGSDMLHS